MMKRLSKVAVAVACLLAMAVGCIAAEFSADIVTKMGKMTMNSKLYCQGKKIRQEVAMGGTNQIVIVRPDKHMVYLLDPAKKTYMEMSGQAGMDIAKATDPAELSKHGAVKKLGTEKVNGYVCDKTKFTPDDKRMGTSVQWVSKELQWPLKMESKNAQGNISMNTKNIKKCKQPNSLFEVPKGYKKQAMPKSSGMPMKAPARPPK